jgi:hypothetical protein
MHEVFRRHRFQSFLQERARFHLQSSNGLNACCANLTCLPFRQNESAAATIKIRQSVLLWLSSLVVQRTAKTSFLLLGLFATKRDCLQVGF